MRHLKIACVVVAAIVCLPFFLIALCFPAFRRWLDGVCRFDYDSYESFSHASRREVRAVVTKDVKL